MFSQTGSKPEAPVLKTTSGRTSGVEACVLCSCCFLTLLLLKWFPLPLLYLKAFSSFLRATIRRLCVGFISFRGAPAVSFTTYQLFHVGPHICWRKDVWNLSSLAVSFALKHHFSLLHSLIFRIFLLLLSLLFFAVDLSVLYYPSLLCFPPISSFVIIFPLTHLQIHQLCCRNNSAA